MVRLDDDGPVGVIYATLTHSARRAAQASRSTSTRRRASDIWGCRASCCPRTRARR